MNIDTFRTMKNLPELLNLSEEINDLINLFSNKDFTINTISFNNNQNILFNTYYLFKLLVNNLYPLYF